MKQESSYEKWWRLMNIPLMDISQEDLEWAVQQDEFNSYSSKQIFLAEINRRKQ